MHLTLEMPPLLSTAGPGGLLKALSDAQRKLGVVTRAIPRVERAIAPALLRSVRAVVLLAGSVQPTPLVATARRSVLGLPFGHGRTLLDIWRIHSLVLSRVARRDRLPVRILVDCSTPAPTLRPEDLEGGLSVETDPAELRGTGGLLRDLSRDFASDDYILVATAAQLLVEPLTDLAVELAELGADVALASHANGTPSSVMLLRCGCLDEVPSVGFVDMKEQALPAIAGRYSVRVANRVRPVGLPVRALAEYVAALRFNQHRIEGADDVELDAPFAETWQSAGSIVEPGANVDPTATLHDSVVLAGGYVGANAVLVRSLVGPGGVVARRSTVVDQVVSGRRGNR